MAERKSDAKSRSSTPDWTRWARLTWTDLQNWAGERTVSRGRSYQRLGKVRELHASPEGELVAWVMGGSQYANQFLEREASWRDVDPRVQRRSRVHGAKWAPSGTACILQSRG